MFYFSLYAIIDIIDISLPLESRLSDEVWKIFHYYFFFLSHFRSCISILILEYQYQKSILFDRHKINLICRCIKSKDINHIISFFYCLVTACFFYGCIGNATVKTPKSGRSLDLPVKTFRKYCISIKTSKYALSHRPLIKK